MRVNDDDLARAVGMFTNQVVRDAASTMLEAVMEETDCKDRYEAFELIARLFDQMIPVLAKNRSMPYSRYLQTIHWRTVRKYALENARFCCQLCNSTERLEVHHKTYERIGNEDLSDVIVLCRACHAKFHDKLPEDY